MAVTEKKLTDTARFLFQQKIACVNTIGNVCMSWWVSSVVFYGTILAVVWWNRKELTDFKVVLLLGFLLIAFFAGVIYYGRTFIKYLDKLREEISAFTAELGHVGFFDNELSTFRRAMIIGTTSLGLILCALIILWIWLLVAFWNK